MGEASTIVVARDDITRVEIKPQRWYVNIAVRAVRTFLQAFVGFGSILFVGMLVIDPTNYEQWLQLAFLLSFGKKVAACAVVALVIALWSVAQNLVELLTKMDVAKPELRG